MTTKIKMKDMKRLYKKVTRNLVQVGTKTIWKNNGLGDERLDKTVLRWKTKPHNEGSLKRFIRHTVTTPVTLTEYSDKIKRIIKKRETDGSL